MPYSTMGVSSHSTFRPSRHRGQNFLVDKGIQRRIAAAASLPPNAVVVEIGAGTGLLTEALLPHVAHIIAVEIEPELATRLHARFETNRSVRVVNADALSLNLTGLGLSHYHVVANLPFSTGTRLVINLLEAEKPPASMTVLLQRDVVERVCAPPGTMRLLSVIVQSLARPERLFDIPPAAFRPRPKVTSTLVRLAPLPVKEREMLKINDRIAAARKAFGQPRKQLANALGAPNGLSQALMLGGIDPKRRPETLSLTEWDVVATTLKGMVAATVIT